MKKKLSLLKYVLSYFQCQVTIKRLYKNNVPIILQNRLKSFKLCLKSKQLSYTLLMFLNIIYVDILRKF